ncbi:MAG: hypothetical protein ABSH53_03850 [Holophaga sp.]
MLLRSLHPASILLFSVTLSLGLGCPLERRDPPGNPVARVWHNGKYFLTLSDPASGLVANGVAVSGRDIYTVGTQFKAGRCRIVLLKNGAVLPAPPDPARPAEGLAVAVAGGDVYVAGYESRQVGEERVDVAEIWKNGDPVALTDGRCGAKASAVAVADGDVFAGGYECLGGNRVAKVWKNGALLATLSDGTGAAEARALAVRGTDVYVAGFDTVQAR